MGILNLTPDSFSDGGIHSLNPKSLIPLLERYIKAGVTIIDVGGQSTRPQAPEVSTDEEISRVLPLIQYIRSEPRFDCLAISIDTYRASVASAAVKAGANIVNDVSAGVMDPEMLDTVAKLGCTIVLMHMRGTPATMNSLTSYEPDGLIPTISSELLTRVTAAEAAGIFRWRIILDPGIGFAKNQAQNLEILAQFSDLRDWQGLRGFPWVVGTSRKSFIGRITSVQEPGKRQWGTAATITAAIQGGADIIRVHDVMEMTQVAKMADALWRRVPSDAKVVKTVEQTKDPEKY
jgi:2-amino-4-hydroxy-6-hydroxymethyldihydropteridine diphosphokinase/dihydropteroate synthase